MELENVIFSPKSQRHLSLLNFYEQKQQFLMWRCKSWVVWWVHRGIELRTGYDWLLFFVYLELSRAWNMISRHKENTTLSHVLFLHNWNSASENRPFSSSNMPATNISLTNFIFYRKKYLALQIETLTPSAENPTFYCFFVLSRL